ncbi:MAG TPA: hypothetical protein VMO47_17900 [Rhodothermales bacterium]|nr:hypothetical protein [Rhodothermales bacterium]
MSRSFLLALLLPVVLSLPARGQLTNVELLGNMAVRCLGEVPGKIDTFQLSPGNRMPYLRPFLTRHWISRGLTVFIGDSAAVQLGRPIHELRYDPQTASVAYDRAEGDSLVRKVDLSVTHSFISPQGILVDESRCDESVSDVIRSADVERLQLDPWAEARGQPPPVEGWRRWAEPVVVGTSIAAVVYLFFSVRS